MILYQSQIDKIIVRSTTNNHTLMKFILKYLFGLTLILSLISCEPKQGTLDDKGTVKGDTLDVSEGEGEGPLGEDEIGG